MSLCADFRAKRRSGRAIIWLLDFQARNSHPGEPNFVLFRAETALNDPSGRLQTLEGPFVPVR